MDKQEKGGKGFIKGLVSQSERGQFKYKECGEQDGIPLSVVRLMDKIDDGDVS